MTGQPTDVPCPCGGYVLHLAPDKPAVGARAAFTCPACGQRRTFTRTPTGAVFEETFPAAPPAASPPQAQAAPAAPAPLPEPTPVPPGPLLAMTALPESLDPAWATAAAEAFPAPDWHVLPAAGDARQILADVRFHHPAAVVIGDGPAGEALAAAVAALPGRLREAMTVIAVGAFPENDPLAAFRARADATLDAADTATPAARLTRAVSRRRAQPSLFRAG